MSELRRLRWSWSIRGRGRTMAGSGLGAITAGTGTPMFGRAATGPRRRVRMLFGCRDIGVVIRAAITGWKDTGADRRLHILQGGTDTVRSALLLFGGVGACCPLPTLNRVERYSGILRTELLVARIDGTR